MPGASNDPATILKNAKRRIGVIQQKKDEAKTAFQGGNNEEAIRLYSLCIDVCFDVEEEVDDEELLKESEKVRRQCLLNRAQLYLAGKKFSKTIEDCTQVLKEEPENVRALFRRGAALSRCHEYKRAIEDLTQAGKLEPQDPKIREELVRARENAITYAENEKKKFANLFKFSAGGGTSAGGSDDGREAGEGPEADSGAGVCVQEGSDVEDEIYTGSVAREQAAAPRAPPPQQQPPLRQPRHADPGPSRAAPAPGPGPARASPPPGPSSPSQARGPRPQPPASPAAPPAVPRAEVAAPPQRPRREEPAPPEANGEAGARRRRAAGKGDVGEEPKAPARAPNGKAAAEAAAKEAEADIDGEEEGEEGATGRGAGWGPWATHVLAYAAGAASLALYHAIASWIAVAPPGTDL